MCVRVCVCVCMCACVCACMHVCVCSSVSTSCFFYSCGRKVVLGSQTSFLLSRSLRRSWKGPNSNSRCTTAHLCTLHVFALISSFLFFETSHMFGVIPLSPSNCSTYCLTGNISHSTPQMQKRLPMRSK